MESIFRSKYRKSIVFFVGGFTLCALVYYLELVPEFTLPDVCPRNQWKWKPEYADLNGPGWTPAEALVVSKFVQQYLIPPPTDKEKIYNLADPNLQDPSMGQSRVIRKLFKNKQSPGFFIECGALDGETRSNTLYFEKFMNWRGLLIEADPKNFEFMKQKRRVAWISNTCLSTHQYPMMVSFQQRVNQGKIANFSAGYKQNGFVDVQCFPLETMLTAIEAYSVDYFSLDVEGVELDILKTIDFDKFDITSLSVEFIHGAEGKEAIREFMENKGYFVLAEVTNARWLANDFIFVKKSFYDDNFTPEQKLELKNEIEMDQETATVKAFTSLNSSSHCYNKLNNLIVIMTSFLFIFTLTNAQII